MSKKNKFATDRDLVNAIRKQLKLDPELIRPVVQALKSEIKQRLLNGEVVNFKNFGNFIMTKWKAEEIYDINVGGKVRKQVKTVKFKASGILQKQVLD